MMYYLRQKSPGLETRMLTVLKSEYLVVPGCEFEQALNADLIRLPIPHFPNKYVQQNPSSAPQSCSTKTSKNHVSNYQVIAQ